MKGKKITATTIWIIALIVLIGAWKLIRYQLQMYFAKIVAKQVVDDSAYSTLQWRGTVYTVLDVIMVLFALLFIRYIFLIWWKTGKQKT